MKPLTRPQLSSRVTHTAGAGGDGKGEERVSLPFFPPSHHTPRATRESFLRYDWDKSD